MDHITQQNARNVKAGHPERNKTLDQYYRNFYSRPEDGILQIGNINEHVSAEELWKCALEYARRFDQRFGTGCKILDMALHVDEATPHVHVRRVWIAQDKYGDTYVSQTKALFGLGFEFRNTSKWDNEKTEFTRIDRGTFYMVCKDLGIEIETDNPVRRQHLSTSEYKNAMKEIDKMNHTMEDKKVELQNIDQEIEKHAQMLNNITEKQLYIILQNKDIADRYQKQIKEANEKNLVARHKIIHSIYINELKTLYSGVLKETFLRKEGLQNQFVRYLAKKKLREFGIERERERGR